jgi:FkbM family methyltransferase
MLAMMKTIGKRILPASLQYRIRRAILQRCLEHFDPCVVTHSYAGRSLKIAIRDPFAKEWYDKDWDAPVEIAFLRKHSLKAGARVFDLGAHQGVVALILAAEVGDNGLVVAVEANPRNAEIARENAKANLATNLIVLNCAASARTGTLFFNEAINGQVDTGSGARGRLEIAARSIDDLAIEFGQPDLLFIDVEGFECEALVGAETCLANGVDCFVEIHGGCGLETFGGSVARVLSFFPDNKFECYYNAENMADFQPINAESSLTGVRWYLIAIAKKPL